MSRHSCGADYETGRMYNSGSHCQMFNNDCEAECERNSDIPQAGNWGAIAYDRHSGAWGMADESPDKSAAKESALSYCARNGENCKVVETFSKTCAAVASGSDNTIGWAEDPDPREAERQAWHDCKKKTRDESCEVQMSHCYERGAW